MRRGRGAGSRSTAARRAGRCASGGVSRPCAWPFASPRRGVPPRALTGSRPAAWFRREAPPESPSWSWSWSWSVVEACVVVAGGGSTAAVASGTRSAATQPIRKVVPAGKPAWARVSSSCRAARHQRSGAPAGSAAGEGLGLSVPQLPTAASSPGSSVTCFPSTTSPSTFARSHQLEPSPGRGTRSARRDAPRIAPPRMLQAPVLRAVPPGVPAVSTQPATPSEMSAAERPAAGSVALASVVPARSGPRRTGPAASGTAEAAGAWVASRPVPTHTGAAGSAAAVPALEPAKAATAHAAMQRYRQERTLRE